MNVKRNGRGPALGGLAIVLVLALIIGLIGLTGAADAQGAQGANGTARAGPTSISDAQGAQGANLLENPSFEAPYTERTMRVIVAHGWEYAHWDRYLPLVSDGGSSGPIIRPEYKELPIRIDPDRVADGGSAQCWFWMFAVGDAVVYQVVDVTPGQWYQLDFAAASWVTNRENPDADGEMYFSAGIDPRGDTVPWKTGVLWSPFEWAGHDHRRIRSPIVQAQSSRITVFVRAASKWALRHNDAYVDDAHLVQVAPGGAPQPTATPAATSTPLATQTPYPTATPAATPEPGVCPDLAAIRAVMREELDRTKLSGN